MNNARHAFDDCIEEWKFFEKTYKLCIHECHEKYIIIWLIFDVVIMGPNICE